MTDRRRVEYLPLRELQADPRNSKTHDLETIDRSIGRFGVVDLIVRDDRTGYIISGHGRQATLADREARGESAPEGVRVDPESGAWLVPVVTGWASRTDAEASAALIAMNRTTELGGWVDEALLDLLNELDEIQEGFDGVGFGESDLDDLRAAIEEGDGFGLLGETDLSFESEGQTGTRSFLLTMSTAAFVWASEELEKITQGQTTASNSLAFLEVLAGASGVELPAELREKMQPEDQRLGIETFEAEEQEA